MHDRHLIRSLVLIFLNSVIADSELESNFPTAYLIKRLQVLSEIWDIVCVFELYSDVDGGFQLQINYQIWLDKTCIFDVVLNNENDYTVFTDIDPKKEMLFKLVFE